MLGFDPDIDGVVGSVPEVFHSVLEGWEPPRLTRLGKHFLFLAMLIREPEMPFGEHDDYASRMRVHLRFLMRSIVDVYHLHILILESQLVVCWLDLGGILRECHGGEKQDQQWGAEGLAMHGFPHETASGLPLISHYKIIPPLATVNDGNEGSDQSGKNAKVLLVFTAGGSVHSSAAAAAGGREYRRQALYRETCSGQRGGRSRPSLPPLPASDRDPG